MLFTVRLLNAFNYEWIERDGERVREIEIKRDSERVKERALDYCRIIPFLYILSVIFSLVSS